MSASLPFLSANEEARPLSRSDLVLFPRGSDTPRMRLLALAIIAILHLVLFFCWPAPKRLAEQSAALPPLTVWNITLPAIAPENEQAPKAASSLTRQVDKVVKKTSRQSPAIARVPNHSGPIAVSPSTKQHAPVTQEKASEAPALDLESVSKQVVAMDKHREISPIERLQIEQRIHHGRFEATIDAAADNAQRKDCQTAYAGAGLLAIVPLLIDTVTDKGCKWK